MKSVIGLLLILLSVNFENIAQSFTVALDHTELSDTLGSEIVFEFEVTNNSSSELTIYILRVTKSLPDGWSSSLCFSYCFSQMLDSIVTNANYCSTPIAISESRTFSFHVNPALTEGEANFDIVVANFDNPSESEIFEVSASTSITSVKDIKINQGFNLYQNYPNPFNPETVISFEVVEAGNVTLDVYDVLGNQVSTLVNEHFSSGLHTLKFSGADLSSGVYFYRLRQNNSVMTKKMILGK